MATLTVKELAARYKEAARRQALVDRYKAAAARFQKGDRVQVTEQHRNKKWRGDVGTVEKYVPFGKYYVLLDVNGRQIIDESNLDRSSGGSFVGILNFDDGKHPAMPRGASTKVAIDDAFRDAVYPFLRESKFSWLVSGMAIEAKKSGEHFAMRDAAKVLKAWFDGRKPEGAKEEAGYRYIQGGAGQLLMNGLIKGVSEALKTTGARIGLKDVGEAIVAYAEDR